MRIIKGVLTTLFLMVCFRIAHQHWNDIEPEIVRFIQDVKAEAQQSAGSGNAGSVGQQPIAPIWSVGYKTDPMNDQRSLQATSAQYADGGGEFNITAECDDVHHAGISFTIDFFAGDHEAHYMLTGRGDVTTEIRLDSRDSTSLSTSTKFNNEAIIPFINPKADVGGGAAGFVFGLAAAFASAGKPDDLVNSSMLRVRLPLTDGRNPIVPIGLRDRALQGFFTRCGFPSSAAQSPGWPKAAIDAVSPTARFATVVSLGLNLREGPSTGYQPVWVMPRGTRAKILGSASTGWLQLEVSGEDGAVFRGYANPDNLKLE